MKFESRVNWFLVGYFACLALVALLFASWALSIIAAALSILHVFIDRHDRKKDERQAEASRDITTTTYHTFRRD